jgi:hypothetical protein
MKETITYRFNNFKRTEIGAIPTLSKAIRGGHYGKQEINNAFKKFVPKGEFAEDERDEILNDLYIKNSSEEIPEKTFKIKDLKND